MFSKVQVSESGKLLNIHQKLHCHSVAHPSLSWRHSLCGRASEPEVVRRSDKCGNDVGFWYPNIPLQRTRTPSLLSESLYRILAYQRRFSRGTSSLALVNCLQYFPCCMGEGYRRRLERCIRWCNRSNNVNVTRLRSPDDKPQIVNYGEHQFPFELIWESCLLRGVEFCLNHRRRDVIITWVACFRASTTVVGIRCLSSLLCVV